MSSVNLFLLALSVGLSIALYQKSRADPKHTSSSSSSSGASSKKSNKKKKKNKAQTVDDKRVSKPTPALAPAPKPAPVDQNKEETKASQSQDEADPATTANEAIRAKHNASSAALHDHLDDMRDEEVDPTPKYSHVARIPAPAPAGPRSVKLTASDIEDGWESVSTRERSKNKSVPSSSAGNNSFANVASTNPFSALESKPQPVSSSWVPAKSAKSGSTASTASASASSSSAPTKKQRQNAAKTAAKRAAKEADEQERLDRLARHRREQEREKARQATPKAPTPFTVKKATPASGPRASLNERGALVWE